VHSEGSHRFAAAKEVLGRAAVNMASGTQPHPAWRIASPYFARAVHMVTPHPTMAAPAPKAPRLFNALCVLTILGNVLLITVNLFKAGMLWVGAENGRLSQAAIGPLKTLMGVENLPYSMSPTPTGAKTTVMVSNRPTSQVAMAVRKPRKGIVSFPCFRADHN
jgi:hypothetical protein